MREKFSQDEWEALVGGSLLNKLGALIFIIGLAYGVSYLYPYMTPWQRAALGLAVSLTMLISGVFVERKERYRVFSRGLLGGGWAGLYFTTYAMHAVDATRVIDSPWAGGIALILVACGMIAHSLRYRSQTLTALAYFIAFATLAITPVTTLSVVALVPLAASLLFIAVRFNWSSMALFGLIATWGTLISRGSSDAPASQAQFLFTIYWLLFEAFDLLRARQRTAYAWWESLIQPLNALAFAGLTYLKWSTSAPQHLALMAALVAAAYLASAVLRTRLRPPSSFSDDQNTLTRILWGGYEGPITIAAALSAAAVLLKFHGMWATFGLLAEAECLFLAGLYFRQAYPRQLGATLFLVDAVKMLWTDQPVPLAWTWPTTAMAALFYLNRYLQRSAILYGYAASAACAVLIGIRVPEPHLGVAWFGLASALFAFGWLRRLEDFRYQAYGAAVIALFGTGIHQGNVAAGVQPPARFPWIALSASALAAYLGVWSALRSADDRFGESERNWLRTSASWAVSALLATLVWRIVPADYLGLGWLVLALALLELGLRELPPEFKSQSFAVFALGACGVLVSNIVPVHNDGPVALRLIPVWSALVAYAFAARLQMARDKAIGITAFSSVATFFAAIGLWAILPPAAVGPAYAALALLLVETGLSFELPGVAAQGHIMSVVTFGRLFVANFVTSGSTAFLSHRVVTVAPVIAGFYHLWRRLGDSRFARYYVHAAAILVVALMRFELGRTYAVLGWAAFAIIVLILGQRRDWPDLRWQSYIIAGLAFARGVATGFNSPDSFSGATGRIGVAAIVIACLYAAQLLVPQSPRREGIERFARTYFSVLGTVLLTLLLFHEVSGGILTVAWGLEGVGLLIAGFPLRDRVLRLSGLFMFLICILKLCLDLRNMEQIYVILTCIVLGLLLISVSWVYTRYRERIQRFL